MRDFNGVIVSDFYTGYDSIECKQQKKMPNSSDKRFKWGFLEASI
jgi:hypothetical protein